MIADFWTIEPAGSPGLAKPLHSLGITGATLSRATQSAATLALTIGRGDAMTMDLSSWAWESQWVLRRGGAIEFRGRVATPRRSGDASRESVTIELRDLWWDLERTPYTEEWESVRRDGSTEPVRSTRARLAINRATGERGTTREALAQIVGEAAHAGVALAYDLGALPTLRIPPIEAANQSIAELVRAVMRWHPGASAAIEHAETHDTLRIRAAHEGDPISLTLGSRPLSALDITEREDQRVDAAHMTYETETTRYSEHPPEDPAVDVATIRTRRRLVVHRDVYPPGAAMTRRSLVATLPLPPLPEADAPPPPIPHMVAIKTRKLPKTGDFDRDAEKFWLDLLGLSAIGLETSDIRLPRDSTDDIQKHRVRFAWEANDEDDPAACPDPVNPESTPVWRPASVDGLPRMLVSGTLASWMRVRASDVVVDCSVSVSKAAVDALGAADKKRFMALSPVSGSVLGEPAWILYRQVGIVGTTAKSRIYKKWPAVGSASPLADMQAAWDKAKEDAIIPLLAQRLWAERQALPLEGSVTLSAEEVGATRYLGRRLRLIHPDRPEWSDATARVRAESLDLGSGRVSLQFGPDSHLDHQDRAALHGAMRRASKPEVPPLPAPEPPATEPDEDEPVAGAGGVFSGGVFSPRRELLMPPAGGSVERLWDLEVTDAESAAIKLLRPGTIILDLEDLTATLAIGSVGATFNPAAGWTLRLKVTGTYELPVCTLVCDGDWTGDTGAIEKTGTGSTAAFEAYHFPLWAFYGVEGTGRTLIADGLWAKRLVGDYAFVRGAAGYHKAGDRPYAIPFLKPYHIALDAA